MLATRARLHGDAHASLAPPLQILARIALRRESRPDARAHAERALEILERANTPSSPKLFDALALLVDIALADARHDDALALATRLLAIAGSDPARARAHLELAQVHWARDDHTAAHAAATAASPALPDEARAWLAEHPLPGK